MRTSVQNGKTESWNGNSAATLIIHHSINPPFHYSTIGYPNACALARPHPNPTYESTPFIRHERIARGRRLVSAFASFSRVVSWTGGSSLNWSDPANWDSPVPGSADSIIFGDSYTGYTNLVGAANNSVDSSFTVGAIAFTANSSNTAPILGKHFFNTLIPSGSVLNLVGGQGEPTLLVGNGVTGNFTNYTTIAGAGSLVVNNPAGRIEVQQVSRATLDLSGLSNFTANIANLWVGASPVNSGTAAC